MVTTTFVVLPSKKLQGKFKILVSHACVSGSYHCFWRACWSYIEVTKFLHLRPLWERAALNRFSFLSKRLHCVKVLFPTVLNSELLIVTLELALTITNAVIFNWQNSKRKLCFSIHVIQSHSTRKLREIQLRTQTDLVMHRLQHVTFVNIDNWDGMQHVSFPVGGRGGGKPNKVLFEAQPLTLIYLYNFWQKAPLSCIFHWKMVRLSHTFLIRTDR